MRLTPIAKYGRSNCIFKNSLQKINFSENTSRTQVLVLFFGQLIMDNVCGRKLLFVPVKKR